MAFPQKADTNSSVNDGGGTSHTVSLPANIDADDLLIIFFATDGDNTVTDWDGFTGFFNLSNATASSLSIGWKKATGSEGATVTLTTSSSEKSAHVSWRITGAEDPDTQAPEASTGVTTNSQFPDPDLLTPTGGAKDYLWIAVEGNDDDDTATVFPLPDHNETSTASGSGSCSVGVCADELNQASLNPSTFTIPTEQWVACTVAVHPVSGPVNLTINVNDSLTTEQALD